MIDFPASPANGQVFISGSQSWTFDGTKWVASGTAVMPPLSTGDNRIINGDMRIDQRNNGASGPVISGYMIDRWAWGASSSGKYTFGRNLGPPSNFAPGFPYCLGFSVVSTFVIGASDYNTFVQPIEGDMVSDLAWGTPQAQPATLSFWARASVAGNYGGTIYDPAGYNHALTGLSVPVHLEPLTAGRSHQGQHCTGDTAGAWSVAAEILQWFANRGDSILVRRSDLSRPFRTHGRTS